MIDKYIVKADYFKTNSFETTSSLTYKLLSAGIRCINFIRSFYIDVPLEHFQNVLNNAISPVLKKIAYMHDCNDPLFIPRKVKYDLYDNTNDEIEIYTFNPKYYDYVGDGDLIQNRRCIKFINYDNKNDVWNNEGSINERLILFMHDSEEDVLKYKEEYNKFDNVLDDPFGFELFNIKFNYFRNLNTGKIHSVTIAFEAIDDADHYKGYGHVYCLDCLFHILKYTDGKIINTISVSKLF